MDLVRNVLIIDDSRLSRLMIRKIVLSYHSHWYVAEAEDAATALELCREQLFDFITLDFNMPGMNGMEAYPALRALQQDSKIGLFSANVQKSIRDQAEAAGLEFIGKPLSEEKVMAFFGN